MEYRTRIAASRQCLRRFYAYTPITSKSHGPEKQAMDFVPPPSSFQLFFPLSSSLFSFFLLPSSSSLPFLSLSFSLSYPLLLFNLFSSSHNLLPFSACLLAQFPGSPLIFPLTARILLRCIPCTTKKMQTIKNI